MNRNRFEFLELEGEGEKPPPPQTASEEGEPILQGRDPIAELGPDGEPLAQVREADTRAYRHYIHQTQDTEAVEALRKRLRVTPGTLRAAEVFGARGQGVGQFNFPAGLAVDRGGVLYVADSYNHRVQRVTPDGGVSILGARGSARGQFLSPQDVATDSADSFYIVEQGNHRVQKYAADGTLQLVFGKMGLRDGEFRGPTGIAVAPGSGHIYVADAGNARVQRFDPSGYFLMAITGAGGAAFNPQAVAVNHEDTLLIADPFTGQVWRYDSLGRPAGPLRLRLRQPRALACGADSLLYVADMGESSPASELDSDAAGRVQAVHSGDSRVFAAVQQAGRRLGGLSRPGGLAVAPGAQGGARDDLYVSDTRNHRILRFVWE